MQGWIRLPAQKDRYINPAHIVAYQWVDGRQGADIEVWLSNGEHLRLTDGRDVAEMDAYVNQRQKPR